MRGTPETDANCWRDVWREWVASNLARRLERERDEARELFRTAMELGQQYKDERDEANAARKVSAADWQNQLANMAKCVAAAKKRAVCAEKERDEARDLADAAMWEADRLRSRVGNLTQASRSLGRETGSLGNL